MQRPFMIINEICILRQGDSKVTSKKVKKRREKEKETDIKFTLHFVHTFITLVLTHMFFS